MNRLLLACFILLASATGFAQQGYAIDITLKPFKNNYIYLGYYYGSKKALADSAMLDANSKGIFKGTQRLPGGIYFVVSPRKEILFEVLIDEKQQFSILADTSNIPNGVVFANSPDNTIFQQYTNFANRTGQASAKATRELGAAKNAETEALNQQIKDLGVRMQLYRDSLTKKHPNSILTTLFTAMREPVIPTADKHPGGKYDSNYAYQYFKSHFWDGVEFHDERLARTPFFEAKVDRYLRELVPPNPDSVIKEVDRMVLYSRSNKEMYKFFMVHFVQKYVNPEYMGQDAVFVHLFEKYINTGQTDFFTTQYKDFMTKRAYSIMANIIGRPAANLEMVDSADKPRALYDIKSDLVVICFWDPTCSHCKETVPRVDSIYHAKWKAQGVTLYGVMTDGGKDNWKKFINENHLKDWVHVYQLPSKEVTDNAAGKPSYKQLYDVYQTPILYLLDKDKRIIAKKLSIEQLNEVIDLKIRKSPSN